MDEHFNVDLSMQFHGLFDSLKDPFLESFFIKGEPDYHLETSLKRCSEFLQEVIAEEYGMELGRGKGRKRQLEVLGQRIIEEMPDRLSMLPADEFKLLMTLARGEAETDEAACGLGFQKKGWIFYYIDNDVQDPIPAIPDEIMEKLKTLIEDKGFVRRMVWNRAFRSCINTFVRLYGVFDREWLFTVIEKGYMSDFSSEYGAEEEVDCVSEDVSAGEKADMAEWETPEMLIEMLREALDRMQDESGNFGMEGDYIFSSDMEEDEDYIKRFDAVKEKPYYEPTSEEIKLYCNDYVDKRAKEYRVLKRYLSKKIDDVIAVERLLEELSIEAVEELGGIFAVPEIMGRYDFVCSSEEDLKEFERLFRNWEDQVRKWNNRGFTNAEMEERVEPGSSVRLDWDLENMKFKADTPDPDAPCPCGSGKKYRQCCGRRK